ncbi:FtsX-like permease family protein, partial [bacterium]|nr:FtsX-like permease family protein [bacterium]
LVGGIGIMNIMLVSVTERTREIGIRKAIGARRFDIVFQFLIEAVVLSVSGGVIGILISIAGLRIVGNIAGFTLSLTVAVALLSLVFSVVVGLIFGIYPAAKASGLKPIDALRYE